MQSLRAWPSRLSAEALPNPPDRGAWAGAHAGKRYNP